MAANRKTVSVLTVGDEILSGEISDTNFRHIAKKLYSIGIEISKSATTPDDIESISRCIGELLGVSDILLITGGLGPTTDDLTREAMSKALGRKLVKRDELEEYMVGLFQKHGRRMPATNLKQAYVPEGAGIIEPAGGTAAGITAEHNGKLMIALPGVPSEMEKMFESYVIPLMTEIIAGGKIVRTAKLNVFGIGESAVEERLAELVMKNRLRYGFLAKSGQVTVKLTAEAATVEEVDKILNAEKERVYKVLGGNIFSEEDTRIEEVAAELLKISKKTVAVAESLTAGMVAERIVNVPGSSSYFPGGVVCYSNWAKSTVLGIKSELLEDGAVNEAVARAMAVSVRRLFESDIGISTTGLAGPDTGAEREAVGTVCIGLSHDKGVRSWKRMIPGDRNHIRIAASTSALNILRLHLQDVLNGDPFH